MIPVSNLSAQLQKTLTAKPVPLWQQQAQEAIRDPRVLADHLEITAQLSKQDIEAVKGFPLRVPRPFVSRMRKGDLSDPLLRQVLPLAAENEQHEGFSADPVGDINSRQTTSLLHKYAGRALLVTTPACGIHCRYCFRREYPYSDAPSHAWDDAIEHLRKDSSINEVILSGGDPLTVADSKLTDLISELEGISHLRRIRVHSRQPIVIPSRVNDDLLEWLADTHLQSVLVVHCNHPNELDEAVYAAMDELRNAGVTVLNQSVLLKGVNDNSKTLIELSEKLFDAGIMPYYLHQLDRVTGASHFEVDDQQAMQLMDEARRQLPGFLVPRLVREVAGAAYKVPLV